MTLPTLSERIDQEQRPHAVPCRPSHEAMLIDLAKDGSDDTIHLVHASQAVLVACELCVTWGQDVDREWLATLWYVESTTLINAIGDRPRIEYVAEN